MRVAIVGAGNLGLFLGAHLATAGQEVFFCSRRPIDAVEVHGLPAVAIPAFQTDPPPADFVLLTVKAYDTGQALSWLPRLCAGSAPVAVIQNGIHHAARVAPWPCIAVLSYVYVEAKEGVYHGLVPPREHFSVPDDAGGARFAGLFSGAALEVRREPAFETAAWRKMLHNCVSNPLTALAGRGLEIFREPYYHSWAGRIMDEALPIARADRAGLGTDEPERVLEILASYPAGTRTSMLQDLERGKRLEIEVLNGALVMLGRRYGIPTPVNEDLVIRLRAASSDS